MSDIDFTTEQPFADLIVISSDGQKLYFSKFALCAVSDYFRAMFNGGFKEGGSKEINLEESTELINTLFNLIINPKKYIKCDLKSLMILIDKYLMQDIKYRIEITLSYDYLSCDKTTVFNIAINYKLDLLKKVLIEKIFSRPGEPWLIGIRIKELDPSILTWEMTGDNLTDLLKKYQGECSTDKDKMNSVAKYITLEMAVKYPATVSNFLSFCDHTKETSVLYRKMYEMFRR